MKFKVLITDSGFENHSIEENILNDIAQVQKVSWENEEELIKRINDADALLVQWTSINKRVIDALTRCKIIVRYGIGYDNIDISYASKKGIIVCNVPDYCIEEVADHTIALTLSLLRQIPETNRNIRLGVWNNMLSRPVGTFSSLKFGLAGFGRIAKEVAKRALGLGFQVQAYDPFVIDSEFTSFGVNPISINSLFETSDVLTLHLPLNQSTKHFVNLSRLNSTKKNIVIINTSRGGLIDTDALISSLKSGSIWGAALDVFEEEPLPPNHSIFNSPNVILSSHVAWFSNKSIPLLQQKAAEEVRRHLVGSSVINKVN